MPSTKKRLDQLLVDTGLAETKAKAQALIMAGSVLVNDIPISKSGHILNPETSHIRLKDKGHPWVSRGGLKLIHAIESFDIDVKGQTAIDVGASTGGFTDVLLHHGASKIYAVDVGHGQLDWKLRSDDRVVVLEKTNARYLTATHIPDPVDLVVCDASFISLTKVLPAALDLTVDKAQLIALIKPQFEAGRDQVGKGGVITDPAVHQEVCDTINNWMSTLPHWTVHNIIKSPVLGPKGNTEFLLWASKNNK